jgi:hypothetical protein
MSALGAMLFPEAFPDTRLLVGLEDDPDDGSLMVFVGARYKGIHAHVTDPEQIERVRLEYGTAGHVFADIPAAALCDCHPELTPALAAKEPTE